MTAEQVDLIILGDSLFGSMLGAIMARHGKSVVIVDQGVHPRFLIGESTIPQTTSTLRMLAAHHDIPEIGNLADFNFLKPTSGVKRNFGFVYHYPGEEHHPDHVTQSELPVPGFHYFRQDVDGYMHIVARKYGAVVYEGTRIEAIEIDQDKVVVATNRYGELRGRYLVDGTGHGQVLARLCPETREGSDLQTHSRGLFTHMIDVPAWDEIVSYQNTPSPWHQGSLHHLCPDGWAWVIPFNNHPDASNPRISVGLNLNARQSPKPQNDAPSEFEEFLSRYPTLQKQLGKGIPIRDWIQSPGRTQYFNPRIVGDRYSLLSSTSGFIDPLYSRGMVNSAIVVHLLTVNLLKALERDSFEREAFLSVETMQKTMIEHNDQLVHTSYLAFADYALWKTWFGIWWTDAAVAAMEGLHVLGQLLDGDPEPSFHAAAKPSVPGYDEFFNICANLIERAASGKIPHKEAAQQIDKLHRDAPVGQFFVNAVHHDGKYILMSDEFQKWAHYHLRYDAPDEIASRCSFDVGW